MKGDRLCPQVSRLWFMKGKDASQADDGHRVEDGGAAMVSPTPSSDSVTRARSGGRATRAKPWYAPRQGSGLCLRFFVGTGWKGGGI